MTTPWNVQPVLGATDVERAVDYYTQVLGFSCTSVFAPPGDEGPVYALLEREGAGLHLQIRRRALFPEGRNRVECDAYFYVPDADALFAEVSARGARILRPVEDGPNYGLRDFLVEDLDGNRLLFGSDKKR